MLPDALSDPGPATTSARRVAAFRAQGTGARGLALDAGHRLYCPFRAQPGQGILSPVRSRR
jgi:hypothetical protein